jgi:hypothetical protein
MKKTAYATEGCWKSTPEQLLWAFMVSLMTQDCDLLSAWSAAPSAPKNSYPTYRQNLPEFLSLYTDKMVGFSNDARKRESNKMLDAMYLWYRSA